MHTFFLRPRPALLAASLSAALALAACNKPPAAEPPVRAVKLLTIGAASAAAAGPEYAGEIRAEVESRLGFRVGGKIVERAVEPGQRVKAGQLLARLDARDFRLAADAASAQVAAALAQRDLAAADWRRYSALREKGFISSAELDRRSAALKAAESALRQARAQQAAQGNQTGYTQLLADADGVITSVDAEAGQVVAAGAPVVRLARDGARDVAFAVPEGLAQQLQTGQPVQARLWAGDEALPAHIREVAASADPATRTYAVKAALQGQAAARAPLGATAYVTLPAQAAQTAAIALPTSALWQAADGHSSVWVFEPAQSAVRAQRVQVDGVQGEQVRISAGLEPGMQIVTSGVHVLQEGQKVSLYRPRNEARSEAPPAAHPETPAAALAPSSSRSESSHAAPAP